MYRIQLASREEAAYRSLDEFAIAVQYGIVDSDALIFHAKARAWLPIESHPHYRLAQTMAMSMPVPNPSPDTEPAGNQTQSHATKGRPRPAARRRVVRKLRNARPTNPVPKPPAVPEPVVIQVPATVSKPRRAPEPNPGGDSRSRSKPVKKKTVKIAVPNNSETHPPETDKAPRAPSSKEPSQQRPSLDQLRRAYREDYSYAIDGLERLPVGPQTQVRKRSKRPLVMAVLVGSLAIIGRWSTLPKVPVIMAAGVTAGLEAPPPHLPITEKGSRSTQTAPASTSSAMTRPHPTSPETYRGAYGQAQADYRETLSSLEFGNLFVARRLSSVDSLRVVRRLVQTAQNVVGVYRDLEVRIDQQFDRPTPSLREPYETAMMADSLLSTIDGLFGILLANDGQYRLRGGRIKFEDETAAANYSELASWLRSWSEWYRNRPEGMPLTIAPIILASSAPPPPRISAGS